MKAAAIRKHLSQGSKVKVTLRFRGREVTHPEVATQKLTSLVAQVLEVGKVTQAPRLEGKVLTTVLVPVV